MKSKTFFRLLNNAALLLYAIEVSTCSVLDSVLPESCPVTPSKEKVSVSNEFRGWSILIAGIVMRMFADSVLTRGLECRASSTSP